MEVIEVVVYVGVVEAVLSGWESLSVGVIVVVV